ncbi:anti-sigma factor antagonist [Bacillus sp. HMF5848]|uniref:STAS domain-containing protein n=1 Tax=Bacillus sp. HMF5848 TaxID=2495421 RepID=UPI000F79B193|nr:STAS domain-containing protein [Bacillus sp. HMF5848]RSK28410.1 anti-sigma factor antagonist [Bacillus sp. HMF5848]
MNTHTYYIGKWEEDVTIKNIEDFRTFIQVLLEKQYDYFILSLCQTQYLNSSALGVIANGVIQARKENRELVIIAPESVLREIFGVVKFHSFMKIFQTTDEAIRYIEGQ